VQFTHVSINLSKTSRCRQYRQYRSSIGGLDQSVISYSCCRRRIDKLRKGRELFSEIPTRRCSCITFCQHCHQEPTECSFPSLSRLSLTTITPTRLNNLLILHVHKHMANGLDIKKVARELTLRQPGICQTFGTYF